MHRLILQGVGLGSDFGICVEGDFYCAEEMDDFFAVGAAIFAGQYGLQMFQETLV